MKTRTFTPKRPITTLMAILHEGEHPRSAYERRILWEIRYEAATGNTPGTLKVLRP